MSKDHVEMLEIQKCAFQISAITQLALECAKVRWGIIVKKDPEIRILQLAEQRRSATFRDVWKDDRASSL
jgi:hypothetical protein